METLMIVCTIVCVGMAGMCWWAAMIIERAMNQLDTMLTDNLSALREMQKIEREQHDEQQSTIH